MLSWLFPSISNREKEITIVNTIKDAERGKKHLQIAIFGEYEEWIKKWISDRGHKLDSHGKDISIYVDYKLSEAELAAARKRSKQVAVIYPSELIARLPPFLSKKVQTDSHLSEKQTMDAQIQDIAYGLWSVAYFNFTETPARYELSAVFCMIVLMMILVNSGDPPDDLLRHVKAYQYDFDYSNIFANSWNFSFDPYLLFDMFVGALDEIFGIHALKIMQMLCFITFAVGFFMHTKKWSQSFRILILVLVLLIIGSRIELARPAVFEAFLFVIGLALTGIPAIILGTFMGAIYYLFPIFLIPLATVRKEYIIAMILPLIFWVLYAGTGYFTDIYLLISGIVGNRIFPILENASIITMLADPFFLILVLLFIKSKNYKYWIPIVIFIAFNQTRFIDVLVPLLAISLDEKKLGFDKIKMGMLEKTFFAAIMVAFLAISFSSHHIEEIRLEDSTIMCESMECMFNIVYFGDNISITPNMEIGMTEQEIQRSMKQIELNGTLNCSIFEKYEYDYLVESNLQEIPACLELVDIHREYRIWKVLD